MGKIDVRKVNVYAGFCAADFKGISVYATPLISRKTAISRLSARVRAALFADIGKPGRPGARAGCAAPYLRDA
jgi:hypothetical protein